MSDFDKYIRQGEPDSKEKARMWQTAIGLQDVDGADSRQAHRGRDYHWRSKALD